uniref:T-cell surface glycoprotein CD3 delta chain-like isoform X2 n=1 Tax=Pristiophorus japonicus TaxID=55135 RepID=UPI00398F6674
MLFHKLLLILTILLFGSVSAKAIVIKDVNNGVMVTCANDIKVNGVSTNLKILTVSDPASGFYSCDSTNGDEVSVYVYLNLCRNCVAMDVGAICGILIASVISTIFIGIAVYSISAQDRSTSHQASDKHPLMHNDANDAVYSPLNNDSRATYNVLANKRRR